MTLTLSNTRLSHVCQIIPIPLLNPPLPSRSLQNPLSPGIDLRVRVLQIDPFPLRYIINRPTQHEITPPHMITIKPLSVPQFTRKILHILRHLRQERSLLDILVNHVSKITKRPRCLDSDISEAQSERVPDPETGCCEGCECFIANPIAAGEVSGWVVGLEQVGDYGGGFDQCFPGGGYEDGGSS